MFLLNIGEILGGWTHKKSVDDLARSMSLNIGKVWMLKDGQEILVPASEICSFFAIKSKIKVLVKWNYRNTEASTL